MYLPFCKLEGTMYFPLQRNDKADKQQAPQRRRADRGQEPSETLFKRVILGAPVFCHSLYSQLIPLDQKMGLLQET